MCSKDCIVKNCKVKNKKMCPVNVAEENYNQALLTAIFGKVKRS